MTKRNIRSVAPRRFCQRDRCMSKATFVVDKTYYCAPHAVELGYLCDKCREKSPQEGDSVCSACCREILLEAQVKALKTKVAAVAALVKEAHAEGWQESWSWEGSCSRIELRAILEPESEGREGEGDDK